MVYFKLAYFRNHFLVLDGTALQTACYYTYKLRFAFIAQFNNPRPICIILSNQSFFVCVIVRLGYAAAIMTLQDSLCA